jgi:hypothetical protein
VSGALCGETLPAESCAWKVLEGDRGGFAGQQSGHGAAVALVGAGPPGAVDEDAVAVDAAGASRIPRGDTSVKVVLVACRPLGATGVVPAKAAGAARTLAASATSATPTSSLTGS